MKRCAYPDCHNPATTTIRCDGTILMVTVAVCDPHAHLTVTLTRSGDVEWSDLEHHAIRDAETRRVAAAARARAVRKQRREQRARQATS